ncbi:uncharacterized protein NFIA_096010 [Aspergillus fischeri NRRL 181]|uniref:Uncharacterized protein n=1 Tax=Neosartorya fischeri (strain ATCC 1020 / DSM 3700 / CBS 544.65 / FGSC A1164 / JCM 1740 / NRRL 181 / WB 181) TaxID=331117 RepID=A1DAU1_NEOFI|nr:uncharacterized protein NFIA_096010 [Aspergillus fischeri NRRL 181]EAW19981.1 hypothetical protein NFIA_096010 [Aspergillus fischeri NRRL 181]
MSDPRFNPNPSFGSPSPPGSPRKRRSILRESEESEGTMEIEQYLTSCDPYRSTNLPNFWPYPVMLTSSSELQQTLRPIKDDISAILKAHGFHERVPFLPYVAQKPHYPGGDTAVNLLRVILLAADDHPRRLGPAKDDLARLLNERGITDMFVEIVNIDLCFKPSLFPMPPEHGLVVGFEEGKQRIIDLLQARLGDNWRLLCPFNIGRLEAEARPAIVILVDPLTRANWSVLDTEIKALLAGHCQFQTIEVEFLPGDLRFLSGTSFAGRADVPAMGSSVGIRGDTNSGTLGGYVTLKQGDKVLKGFLTSYHVTRPLDPKVGATGKSLGDLDRFGSSWMRQTEMNHIEMESFSRLDTQSTLSDLDDKIKTMDEQIEMLSERIRKREMGGGSATKLRNRVNEFQSLVSGYRRERQNVASMPHLMGRVTATSGKATLGKRISDWAFVEMNDAAIEKFFRPNRMFPVRDDQQPGRYKAGPAGVYLAPSAGEPLTDFGPLVKGDVYFKMGRTTGVTTGVCHGTLAICRWKDCIRYDHIGNKNDLSVTTTEEYIIMSRRLNTTEHTQASFVEDGDSGSLVVDTDGKVCGLVYSGFSGKSGPSDDEHFYVTAGLVTPIAEVAQSVKLRTMRKDKDDKIISAPAELGLPQPSESQS